MNKINVMDIAGTEYPAGRKARVVIGPNGIFRAQNFVQGYSVVYPGGGVPEHTHPQEECYTIVAGSGEMTVGGETCPVRGGDYVYIPSGVPHSLKNCGTQDMIMMFVYAPAGIVEHWQQESAGELK